MEDRRKNAKATNRYSGNTAFAGVLDYLWNWTRDGYAAELSLEGRDDAVEPLCFEFDLDEQRNIFQGTKSETVTADRQERSSLDLGKVLRHLPDSPNGATVAEVMARSGVKKWKCRELLNKAVNAKFAVRVGVGSVGSPSSYYRTPAAMVLVRQVCSQIISRLISPIGPDRTIRTGLVDLGRSIRPSDQPNRPTTPTHNQPGGK